MINNHVRYLFGGETCVCCWTKVRSEEYDVPILSLGNIKQKGLNRISAPLFGFWDAAMGLQKRRLCGNVQREAERFLKEQEVDVILCELGNVGATIGRGLLQTGIPIYCYFRGKDASEKLRSTRQVATYRRYIPKFSGILSVSGFLVENLREHGISHPNTHILPSGVDVELFRPGPKRKNSFVAVGRLIEKKRPDITVRAFCQAAKGHSDALLTVVGGGPMQDECMSIAEAAGMGEQVKFLGEQSHDEVRAQLSTSEFFLQHSVTSKLGDTEGAPTAIQEAMACGCMVIATRHAGIPELVLEGETGFLVPEHDEEGYRARISDALMRRPDVERMAERSREYAVTHFDASKLYGELENALRGQARL